MYGYVSMRTPGRLKKIFKEEPGWGETLETLESGGGGRKRLCANRRDEAS